MKHYQIIKKSTPGGKLSAREIIAHLPKIKIPLTFITKIHKLGLKI